MRFLKRFLKSLLCLIAICTVVLCVFIYQSVDSSPLVTQSDAEHNSTPSIAAANSASSNPTGLISISDNQLGKLIQQLLKKERIPSNVLIEFAEKKLIAKVTLRLPLNIDKRYINLTIEGLQSQPPKHLRIDKVMIGSLRVPAAVIRALRDYALKRCNKDRRCRAGLGTYKNISSIELHTGVLKVRYTLGADTLSLLGKTDIDDLSVEPYQQALEALWRKHNGGKIELHTALQTVVQVASDRSNDNDPIKENASALMALAMLNADRRIQELRVQADTSSWPSKELRLIVHGRRDLAKHFVNSSALFLIGGTEFSDYVGIYKEVYDVSLGKQFGTGDLVADRAGVRFAKRATRSQTAALELQERVLQSSDSSGYLLSKDSIKRFENEHTVNATDQIGGIVTVIDEALRQLPLLH